MKYIVEAGFAVLLCIGLSTPLLVLPSYAETQVLESDVPDLPTGATIADDAKITIPDGATLRVLDLSKGETKALKGPYTGTVENYKEELSWWERYRRGRESPDAPIGATRGLRAE